MTAGPPNTASPSAFTCLLRGTLDEFLPYIGKEQSNWLIEISHDICDPARKRGSLKVWDASGEGWRDVNPTDPPTASTYLYVIWDVVPLTKFSERVGKSKTSSEGNASAMANRVKQRDGQECWVTRGIFPNSNGHICPKRMGDNLLRVSSSSALSIHDEICGITLSRTLNDWFDNHELGLRLVAPDKYICHSFPSQDWPQHLRRTIYGGGSLEAFPASIPPLHGHEVSPPQPQHARNPPPGLLRWHYLQCVIRKFAHSDYKNLQNISYCELSLKMEGDSEDEDEGTDSECEWPSVTLDRGRAMQMAVEDREVLKRVVAEWVTGV
ncbi:hypothetical protein BGY98DRAFT_952261 [Russula aff. rugulosa BPL654]|nr:hypothetical protein BGY98DRAFT_952261 [Russula aff. rugulosa BPL654]